MPVFDRWTIRAIMGVENALPGDVVPNKGRGVGAAARAGAGWGRGEPQVQFLPGVPARG